MCCFNFVDIGRDLHLLRVGWAWRPSTSSVRNASVVGQVSWRALSIATLIKEYCNSDTRSPANES